MFDDQPNNPGTGGAPQNLPVEPEDIFADTDKESNTASATPKALGAGYLKPKAAAAPTVMPRLDTEPGVYSTENYNTKSPVIGKVIIGIAVLAVVGGMAFGGWWLYGKFFASTTTTSTTGTVNTVATTPIETQTPEPTVTTPVAETETQTPEPTEDVTPSSTVAQMQNDELLFGERKDSDNDGLDDISEEKLLTDIRRSDSDNDDLCDGDEVLIWKSDPLKTDSDKDKHPDGTEVYNAYNPMGPGKLGPLPDGVSTSTACQTAKR